MPSFPRLRSLNLGVFAVMAVAAAPASAAAAETDRIVLALPASPGNPRNSEGSFVTLEDGRILFAYSRYSGKQMDDWADHASADIAARVSDDGGRTWSSEDRILVPNEGACNVMSASLLRLQDGRIGLFDARGIAMFFLSDDGRTWLAARDIETDPDRGFCYTAIHFTDDAVLLAYCCGGGKRAVLQDACIRRLPLESLRPIDR